MSIPSTTIDPPVGSSRVLMQRSIVDFPDPEGPTTQTTSPLLTSRLISVSTWLDPKLFCRLRIEMIGVGC